MKDRRRMGGMPSRTRTKKNSLDRRDMLENALAALAAQRRWQHYFSSLQQVTRIDESHYERPIYVRKYVLPLHLG
jgi:hypothetical protein